MNVKTLAQMVMEDAAIRRRQRLQPIGGKGDKIFPPTYPGEFQNDPPRHVFERRMVDGQEVWCALVDSVQSQANRMEEALADAVRHDGLSISHVVVDFRDRGLLGLSEITSLEAPHRIYDAILRDSLMDGKPFMESEVGLRLAQASPSDATALLETSPTALVFGAWHSTGSGGGLGAKFARCLTSEIVAIGVPVEEIPRRDGTVVVRTAGRRTGSRIDPLGILKKVQVYKHKDRKDVWDVRAELVGKDAKQVRPSEINHGNIAPTVEPLGITCDYLEQTFVLTFAGLRRLRFGGDHRDITARTLLAALGLLAALEQDRNGYALRSRCDLVPERPAPFEVVHPDGSTDAVKLDLAAARALYEEAFANAEAAGFRLRREPIRLVPQDKLVAIVKESQQLALSGQGGEAEEEK
ncbi:MAG: type I-U CRISPR-associated protein Cas7 [Alicyclobacillus mali]|uniref:type I-G CRISPR-associated RAMP protein Csb1/Cas7g n=1 Tax=Alicyclobacillus mali (ex Roth et al. 2021) TaxID=1123961 RepID=UPI000AD8C005|nr:type I-U CRISPR-associated RAMP protein Csb1/Cas7u [Alicyclobacillus mali (ex Roth et al. 2021)]MCL6489191.1 type I-U CRISPR-associated protein Cas7 [Alicyclobacillus mali (ex Roth et al. 2021)]